LLGFSGAARAGKLIEVKTTVPRTVVVAMDDATDFLIDLQTKDFKM
jgi:hypothetical protein